MFLRFSGALMGSSFRYVIPTGEEGGAAAGKKRVEHLGSKIKVVRKLKWRYAVYVMLWGRVHLIVSIWP